MFWWWRAVIPNLIVPTLNRYDLLERLLGSIDYPIRDLLIVDNGGGLSGVDVPDVAENVHVLRMPANLGIASSWNLGVKSFPFDKVWMFASDDVVFHAGGLEALWVQSSRSQVTVSDQWPHWEAFTVGDEVVSCAGLFDEMLHPANWEDDEYEWRVRSLGFDVVPVSFPHFHAQQGTVNSTPEFRERNHVTYVNNETYFKAKQSAGDLSAGRWSLDVRRNNSWV